MRRIFTSKFTRIGVLAIALIGGAAALAASGGSSNKPHTLTIVGSAHVVSAHHTRNGARARAGQTRQHRRSARNVVRAAASYLGLSVAQLRRELRSGKSLAQIARETPGKSEAGLVHAILTAQRANFATAEAKLARRVKAQVSAPGGPVGQVRTLGLGRTARAYLGLTGAQLRADERGGKSLAQIARETSGKSEAGLIEALVAARARALEVAVRAGALSATAEKTRLEAVRRRMSAFAHRVRHGAHAPSAATP